MITLEGGIQYEDVKRMGGPIIKLGEVIRINYRMALSLEDLILSRNLIDHSDNYDYPIVAEYLHGDLLAGLEIGINGMEKGGTRRLIIPPEFAFRKRGVPSKVPENAFIYVEVTISTKPPK